MAGWISLFSPFMKDGIGDWHSLSPSFFDSYFDVCVRHMSNYSNLVLPVHPENKKEPDCRCNPVRINVHGDPEEIRTLDPLIRSQVLYPAELRGQLDYYTDFSVIWNKIPFY